MTIATEGCIFTVSRGVFFLRRQETKGLWDWSRATEVGKCMNIRVKDGSTGMGALNGYRRSLSMPNLLFQSISGVLLMSSFVGLNL